VAGIELQTRQGNIETQGNIVRLKLARSLIGLGSRIERANPAEKDAPGPRLRGRGSGYLSVAAVARRIAKGQQHQSATLPPACRK
jgi:hypothetical protein